MSTHAHVLRAVGLHAFDDANDWAAALNELAYYSDTEIDHLADSVSSPNLKQMKSWREPALTPSLRPHMKRDPT
jgi:hypothetical protein